MRKEIDLIKMSKLKQIAILFWGIAFLCPITWGSNIEVSSALPYSEGGQAVADPGFNLAPQLRRYVDAEFGDDQNDGMSPEKSWESLSKVAVEKSIFAPGTHVLFKRGATWRGSLDFRGVHGSKDGRVVLGAFGDISYTKPKIEGTIIANESSYIMLRDFDCIKIDASNGAHHVIIFDDVVHGRPELNQWPSNGIRIFGASHHISIVQNTVYDLRANDCIVIHPDGRKIGIRNSFWILDNICIGNSRMEDGIDLAMSEPDGGMDSVIGTDVKVVCNRVQMKALKGHSARDGRGSKCLNAGHDGKYIWIIGNLMGGSQHIGMKLGSDKQYVQVSGNVMFNCANNNGKVTCELHCRELQTENNTLIHTMESRANAMFVKVVAKNVDTAHEIRDIKVKAILSGQ